MGRRPVIIPSIAIAVVAVAAVTIPAVADDGGGTDAPRGGGGLPSATGAKSIAAPQTLAALQRDLGLTEDQARARVRKDRWATNTARALRTTLGDTYAGAWVNREGTQMTVAVTTAAAAAQVRATGAEPKVVARSAKALDTVKARLDTARGTAANASGWYVDVSSNTVTVLARPGKEAAATAAVASTGVPRDAVKVVTSARQPRPLADVRGGDAYLINGSSRCSVGFSVEGGFVTAGHCGDVGDTTTGADNGQQIAQGTVRASSFPVDDFGFVETNAQWTPTAVVATRAPENTGNVPVAGSDEAPVGAAICRTGSTTGTFCGRVTALNATVNYGGGDIVNGLTQTDVCAEPGDSGGSWISGNQAQGVTSGGSGDCTVGGETFFQPVNEILQRNNLTLVTDGTAPEEPEEPGEPEEPAPADCAGHEASVTGNLSGTGARQVTSFFRANAGTHTACIAGPADTDFDVALQRWNGRNWQTVQDANNATSSDTLTFTGPAGTYRYQVRSQSGSGAYTLGVDVP